MLDEDVHNAVRSSAKALFDVAMSESQSVQDVPLYPNYAVYDTPLANIYGRNPPRLRSLRSLRLKVDPHNIMALAGGWKF